MYGLEVRRPLPVPVADQYQLRPDWRCCPGQDRVRRWLPGRVEVELLVEGLVGVEEVVLGAGAGLELAELLLHRRLRIDCE